MRWRWRLALLCLGACSDDAGPELGGLDGSVLDGGPLRDIDSAVIMDAAVDTSDGDLCNDREEQLPVTSALHIEGDVMYADVPPVGGNHNECWAKWGVYDEELADQRWVHNLEHGGVVFLYRCADGCADEVDTMKVFVSGRTQALLTPYAALPTRFAVVSWGRRLLTNCFDMPAFQDFYRDNVDNAPESLASDPPRSCN